MAPYYFQVCKKAGQKSAMLQENWHSIFCEIFVYNKNWSKRLQARSHEVTSGGKFVAWATGCQLFATPGSFMHFLLLLFLCS